MFYPSIPGSSNYMSDFPDLPITPCSQCGAGHADLCSICGEICCRWCSRLLVRGHRISVCSNCRRVVMQQWEARIRDRRSHVISDLQRRLRQWWRSRQ